MSISINSAISAYNNAANILGSKADSAKSNTEQNGGNKIFDELLVNPLAKTTTNVQNAEKVTLNNLAKAADVTDVVEAVAKAESTLKMVVAVRDRLVSAFQKIQDSPI